MAELEKFPLTSMNMKEHQLLKLKELFPEAFTEGTKVDWEKLKLTLGEDIDTGKERFGMNWPGKADCFKTIQQSSIATLIPSREESIDFDTTENLFIEGDNLEVLKLLQKSYLGMIKMIYIDPPYNTGTDFIYPDNYTENLDTYLAYTGQIDSEGKKFSTNTETDGRFHSKWLNMMYPRLFLAKNLLHKEGVIFISISDKEQHNLKAICNEVFGEENFITALIWEKKKKGAFLSGTFTNVKEYILVYSKSESDFPGLIGEINDDMGTYPCVNENNKREIRTIPAGIISKYKEKNYTLSKGQKISAGSMDLLLHSDLVIKEGKLDSELVIEANWRYDQDSMEEYAEAGELYITEDLYLRRIVTHPRLKKLKDILPKEGKSSSNEPFIQESDVKNLFLTGWGTNEDAKDEIKNLTGVKNLMDYPKPTKLIAKLAASFKDNNIIVLDFFGGSCTTAQAILELNKLDNGNRKFICVQLPEITEPKTNAFKAGYKSIAEIGKARIRKVIQKIKNENENKTDIFQPDTTNLDAGFKVFKLAKSNFRVWDSSLKKDNESIQAALELHTEHLSPEATQEAILFELLIKSGFPLSTKIEKLDIEKRTVFGIADGQLLICLEDQLTHELLRAIAERKPSRVICLDKAFQGDNADALKTNAVQIMKSKGVINFRTV